MTNELSTEEAQYLLQSSSDLQKPSKQIIGDYCIGETIGSGTFGKVKVGVHIPTNEKVAVKVLKKNMIVNQQIFDSIESEINILSILLHPNISQLLQIIETNDCYYLVLEYASKGELFQLISQRGKLSELQSCLVFAQALSALEYLHKQNICHRDLKPENMLFDSSYELKIIDFGLGKMSSQKLSTCCGSPSYASPEILSGKYYCGKQSDLWSLGIVLFGMLCGFLPFDDDSPQILFEKINKCEFQIPSEVSPEAAEIIKGLIQKDPKDRMSIQEIKQSEFFKKNIQGVAISQGIIIGNEEIPSPEKEVLDLMMQQGYDEKKVIEDVQKNALSSTSAGYYLLLSKRKKEILQEMINKEVTQQQKSNENEVIIQINQQIISESQYQGRETPVFSPSNAPHPSSSSTQASQGFPSIPSFFQNAETMLQNNNKDEDWFSENERMQSIQKSRHIILPDDPIDGSSSTNTQELQIPKNNNLNQETCNDKAETQNQKEKQFQIFKSEQQKSKKNECIFSPQNKKKQPCIGGDNKNVIDIYLNRIQNKLKQMKQPQQQINENQNLSLLLDVKQAPQTASVSHFFKKNKKDQEKTPKSRISELCATNDSSSKITALQSIYSQQVPLVEQNNYMRENENTPIDLNLANESDTFKSFLEVSLEKDKETQMNVSPNQKNENNNSNLKTLSSTNQDMSKLLSSFLMNRQQSSFQDEIQKEKRESCNYLPQDCTRIHCTSIDRIQKSRNTSQNQQQKNQNESPLKLPNSNPCISSQIIQKLIKQQQQASLNIFHPTNRNQKTLRKSRSQNFYDKISKQVQLTEFKEKKIKEDNQKSYSPLQKEIMSNDQKKKFKRFQKNENLIKIFSKNNDSQQNNLQLNISKNSMTSRKGNLDLLNYNQPTKFNSNSPNQRQKYDGSSKFLNLIGINENQDSQKSFSIRSGDTSKIIKNGRPQISSNICNSSNTSVIVNQSILNSISKSHQKIEISDRTSPIQSLRNISEEKNQELAKQKKEIKFKKSQQNKTLNSSRFSQLETIKKSELNNSINSFRFSQLEKLDKSKKNDLNNSSNSFRFSQQEKGDKIKKNELNNTINSCREPQFEKYQISSSQNKLYHPIKFRQISNDKAIKKDNQINQKETLNENKQEFLKQTDTKLYFSSNRKNDSLKRNYQSAISSIMSPKNQAKQLFAQSPMKLNIISKQNESLFLSQN